MDIFCLFWNTLVKRGSNCSMFAASWTVQSWVMPAGPNFYITEIFIRKRERGWGFGLWAQIATVGKTLPLLPQDNMRCTFCIFRERNNPPCIWRLNLFFTSPLHWKDGGRRIFQNTGENTNIGSENNVKSVWEFLPYVILLFPISISSVLTSVAFPSYCQPVLYLTAYTLLYFPASLCTGRMDAEECFRILRITQMTGLKMIKQV